MWIIANLQWVEQNFLVGIARGVLRVAVFFVVRTRAGWANDVRQQGGALRQGFGQKSQNALSVLRRQRVGIATVRKVLTEGCCGVCANLVF